MKRVLLLCLWLFPIALHADTPNCINCQTAGMVNGRYWTTLDPPTKIFFLVGLMEGIKAGTTSELYTVQGVEGFGNTKGLDAFTCPTCTIDARQRD